MASGRKDSDTWSLFADELRAYRSSRGWSQAELASNIGYSESLIAQVETCRCGPSMELAKALDRNLRTPGYEESDGGTVISPGTFLRLAAKLRTMTFSAPFGSFAPHERDAAQIYESESTLVPGLLQTPEYARAVLETRPNTTAEELDNLVASRLARQEILTRSDPPPPVCWFLLDESILSRPVAPPEMMRVQLQHLVRMSELPHVTITIVPYSAGGHTGLSGSCVIAESPDRPSIVYLDDMADGRVSEDPATVTEVGLRFKALQAEALPIRASRDLIMKVAEERWTP